MASATLYTYPDNFRAAKALIAAKFSGAKIDVATNFTFGDTNKTPGFLAKFPLGKVPALETKSGDVLFESNAIAYYAANKQLRGETDLDAARVVQWTSFADNELLPVASNLVFPTLGIVQPNKENFDLAKETLLKLLTVLNDFLLTRTYLVGERITLADISVSLNLLHLYQHVLEPSLRAPFRNLNRWFTTLINQEQFKSVLGTVKLCERAGGDGKKVSESSTGGKKDKKEKEKAPKKEKPKAEPVDDGDDFADELALEPKSKDPFEAFPKGNFNFDDFKRFYSNNPETKSIPYFWEKFDKENYTIWFCEYKYPEELTMVFMSANLISGMFQRLDKMRKNAFGSMILFGEDNNSSISGIWVWKGPELAFTLSPDWQIDYESYSWKKLDANSDDTKTLVNEYFSWEGKFGGKTFNQGKIFK